MPVVFLKVVIMLLLLLLAVAPASAWTELYSSAPVTGATTYVLERSVDLGETWTIVSTTTKPKHRYTGSETGLTLFRFSACNVNGCTTRAADVIGHNEAWPALVNRGNLPLPLLAKPGVK